MLGYAKLEKAKRNAQVAQAGRTSSDYAGLSSLAGMGNQALLSMLEGQRAQTATLSSSGGTPLPDAMRAKFERQFGLPMDDVRVHHNSDEPAKFDAGAYTYGTDIFIGPGQEDALEHEMTHVAQQKMGQVWPTGMEHGLAVNRAPALEHSADTGAVTQTMGTATGPVVQCCEDRELCDDAANDSDYIEVLGVRPERLRQLLYGAYKQKLYVDFRERCKKDKAVCSICGQPINYTLSSFDADAFTIDHAIPVVRHFNSEGHRNTFGERNAWFNNADNWQPAHRCCNSAKGGQGEHFARELVGMAFQNEADVARYAFYNDGQSWNLFSQQYPAMLVRAYARKVAEQCGMPYDEVLKCLI